MKAATGPARMPPKAKAAARKPPGKAPRAKPKGMASTRRPPLKPNEDGVVLLAGGNPQVAKADGDAPVQAYIAAIPVAWKRGVAQRLDAIIRRNAPTAQKAVKWNSPFYGMPDQGWFASFHVFSKAVKLTFFKGTSLRPVPPGGEGKEGRWIDVHEDDLDEEQVATWVRQAAAIPGWLA